MSARWPKRYSVDLVAQYRVRRRWKHGIALLVISAMQIKVMMYIFSQLFCITSDEGRRDAGEWALTTCPSPPKSISEMSRVGVTFQEDSVT